MPNHLGNILVWRYLRQPYFIQQLKGLMKVKIGDKFYDAEEQPVMIIMTPDDKFSLAYKASEATMYAVFPDNWGTQQEQEKWMMDNGVDT